MLIRSRGVDLGFDGIDYVDGDEDIREKRRGRAELVLGCSCTWN